MSRCKKVVTIGYIRSDENQFSSFSMRKRTKITTRELPAMTTHDEAKTEKSVENSDSTIQRNIQDLELLSVEPRNDVNMCIIDPSNNVDTNKTIGWQKITSEKDLDIEICKEYYTTGYCSSGWACKFVHARDRVALAYDLDRNYENKIIC